MDIQRTLALEESKETSIRGFRLQTLRCNSDTREKHESLAVHVRISRKIKFDSFKTLSFVKKSDTFAYLEIS